MKQGNIFTGFSLVHRLRIPYPSIYVSEVERVRGNHNQIRRGQFVWLPLGTGHGTLGNPRQSGERPQWSL